MIEFADVQLAYAPDARRALDGITLRIDAGEAVAVVGPSGSGKTSLLRLMNALLVPTSGTVLVDGLDTSLDENIWEVRKRVGLIFQNPDNQIVSTTVERELAFGMENLGLPQAVISERIEDALRRFRLTELRNRAPHRLSGGEKQRVAIAAVMSMRPDCLLLDEPTSLLDAAGRRDVWSILDEMKGDSARTVVHVTQFPDEIGLSTRTLVVVGGRIVFDGTPDELLSSASRLESWGLSRPAAMDLADELREAGFQIPADAADVAAIEEALVDGAGGGAP